MNLKNLEFLMFRLSLQFLMCLKSHLNPKFRLNP
jgi:hypothetical protein